MGRKFVHCCCCYNFMVVFTLAVCPFIGFCQDMLPYPVGLYPLDNLYETADASCYGNLGGAAQNVKLVTGPFGKADTAYEFAGFGTSYINIPQFQHLSEHTNSITILVWIFQTGHSGSVVHYLNNDRGVESHSSRTYTMELCTSRNNNAIAQFAESSGKVVSSLTNNTIGLNNKWHYIGASYDYSSGTATLWLDGKDVQQKNLGNLELSTDRGIQIGSGQGKGDSFQGRISCVQIYDRALTRTEVTDVRDRCFKEGHSPVDCGKAPAPSCGVSMNTLTGTFSSPGYPAGYPYDADCVWEIEVPDGYFITLQFGKFDLEASFEIWPNCPDYVVVRDGINSWSKKLKCLCGDESGWKDLISSSGKSMRVEFMTSSEHTAPGFTAKYTTSLIIPDEEKEEEGMMDFSRHYTGIVIGVACAAIFAILSIITFSHTRRRLQERRQGSLTHRHSVSFSDNDVFQQNAPPTYDDVMRYPELYPPTPCQGSLVNTPTGTPRRGSPVSTPTIPHRILNRPGTSVLVPKVGTPIGMPLLTARHGINTSQSTSRVLLQRGISPLARAELTPQHSRHADHLSSDENDGDDDEELPPYPGIMNVDSVLDQVRETLELSRLATSQASNPSLSDSNSSDGNHSRAVNVQRGSQASCTVMDNTRSIQTRLEPNRNSVASVQSVGNDTHEFVNPWVSAKVPRMATPGGTIRSIESDV